MAQNKELEKKNFLETLTLMDQEQLNFLIKQKGKKPKLVVPMIRLTKE